MQRRVLVFGTFDDLHAGHLFFLRTARALGTRLIVSVARDAHVLELKKKLPRLHEHERLELVKKVDCVDDVNLSDPLLGSFEVITLVHPDMIVLGHDQDKLKEAIKDWMKKTGKHMLIKQLSKKSTETAYVQNLD